LSRFFGELDLLEDLGAAGFIDIRVLSEAVPEFGIEFGASGFGRPILARRPDRQEQRHA
jgi:hypothetical protein